MTSFALPSVCRGSSAGRLLTVVLLCLSCSPATGQLNRSTIEYLQRSTVRIVASGGGVSSGVFVTPAGHVLTANHGIPAEVDQVRLCLFGGSEQAAQVLARDPNSDVALLHLRPEVSPAPRTAQTPPTPPIAWIPVATSQPLLNEKLLALGFPARESFSSPAAIRLGTVSVASPQVLRTGCMLTVGDSGGPLLNRLGQLVGVHRQIGAGREANLHVGTEPLLSLLQDAGISQPSGSTFLTPLWPDHANWQLGPNILKQAAFSIVTLHSDAVAGESLGLGARLDRRFMAAKLSLLHPGKSLYGRFSDGSLHRLELVRANPRLDIAVLDCEAWQSLPDAGLLAGAAAESGEIVFAIGGVSVETGALQVTGPGVVTRTGHTEPSARVRLGMLLEEHSENAVLRVREAAPNGPAATAGLRTDDLLIRLNGNAVSGLSLLGRELQQHQPGDWLMLEILQSGNQRQVWLQAGHDPGTAFDRLEYLEGRAGAVSVRRTGFAGVLQHDIPLTPEECGGLLLTADGRLLGWNVARRARESSLGWPWQVLIEELTAAAMAANN